MYHYLGMERLQWSFYSPNVCAAFLVVTLLVTVGAFLFLVYRKCVWAKAGAGVFGIAALIQMLMIGATYSRGGYVAGFAALTAAAIFCRKRWSWVFPALFLAALLFTDGGASRVKSIGGIEDGSIRNRLLVWHYGTGVIAGNWLAGTPEPGGYYTRHYQPLWLNESYHTFINDPLTIAASYGIFALFVLLTFLFFLFLCGFRLWLVTRNLLLLYALAALMGYVIACCFTTCYRFRSIQFLLAALLLLIAGFIVWGFITKRFIQSRFDYWPSPALAIAVCGGLLIYGGVVNAFLPYSWKSARIDEYEVTILMPRNSQGSLFILADSGKEEWRGLLRPLTEQGFTVISLPVERGFGELAAARRLISQFRQHQKSWLVGVGEERAMQVIALADTPGLAGVIAVDPPFDWPFEELSPQLRLPEARIPVLIFLSPRKMAEAENFNELIETHYIPARVVPVPEEELRESALILEKLP